MKSSGLFPTAFSRPLLQLSRGLVGHPGHPGAGGL